jgi:hypothetical protein
MPFLPAPATPIIMPPSERDEANSRLVVGYNTRIVPGEGRKQARGIGWELATDSWGRAAREPRHAGAASYPASCSGCIHAVSCGVATRRKNDRT